MPALPRRAKTWVKPSMNRTFHRHETSLQSDAFLLPVWYFNLTWQSPSGMLFPATGESKEHPAREISILGKPNADKDSDAHPPKQ